MFGSVKEKLANEAFRAVALPKLNAAIAQYGQVKSLVIEDKKLKLVIILAGLEDRDINVTCEVVNFNEDCSKLTLGRYTSDMQFVETALNKYATRTYDINDEKMRVAAKAAQFILS